MNGYNSTLSGKDPDQHSAEAASEKQCSDKALEDQADRDRPRELGGRKKGLEPTRYGDWEKDGRCIDF